MKNRPRKNQTAQTRPSLAELILREMLAELNAIFANLTGSRAQRNPIHQNAVRRPSSNLNSAPPSPARSFSTTQNKSDKYTATPAPNPPDDPSQTMTILADDEEKLFPTQKIVKNGNVHQFKDSVERMRLTEKEIIRTGNIHSFKDKPYEKNETDKTITLTLFFKEKQRSPASQEEEKLTCCPCPIL